MNGRFLIGLPGSLEDLDHPIYDVYSRLEDLPAINQTFQEIKQVRGRKFDFVSTHQSHTVLPLATCPLLLRLSSLYRGLLVMQCAISSRQTAPFKISSRSERAEEKNDGTISSYSYTFR